MQFLCGQGGQSNSKDPETLDMTFYELREMFEGNFADVCAKNIC